LRAEIVLVGTELLLGQIVDTNGPLLARVLAESGIDLYRKVVVGDNLERVANAIREAADRADLILMTGGLGPTVDDLTAEAIAKAFGVPFEINEAALRLVTDFITARGRAVDERQAKQARMPLGAEPLPNPVGSAPGIALTIGDKTVIALPGVPSEVVAILQDNLRGRLERLGGGTLLRSHIIHVGGIPEPEVDRRLGDLWRNPNPTVGVTVGGGFIDVRITAKGSASECEGLLADFLPKVRAVLGNEVFGEGEVTLEKAIGQLLIDRGWTLAVAESCSGGLIADRLTDVPGSSAYLERGVVTYSNRAKEDLLGVPAEVLREYGAVSEPVARLMAEGIRRQAGANIGLSATGIAGPGGGSPSKPVGLVYLGIATPEGTWHRELHLGVERRVNKVRTATSALLLLLDYLKGRPI
jgi:nicotinamide-nucleotide amidase